MKSSSNAKSFLLIFLLFWLLFVSLFLILYPLLLNYLPNEDENIDYPVFERRKDRKHDRILDDSHCLCVIVPYRDRWDQLTVFVPYMNEFLREQGIRSYIYMVNQMDRYRFNRGALLNTGFLYSHPSCDYMALHDIDLLPNSHRVRYKYPPEAGPVHVTAPKYHPFYDFPDYFGGIVLIRREHFQKVNGFSNKFWGWGLEDDEFRMRIVDGGLNITVPSFPESHKMNSFVHISPEGAAKSIRDSKDWMNDMRRKRDRVGGYRSLKFKSLPRVHKLTVDSYPFVQLDVQFQCNVTLTPWCMSEAYL